MLRRHRHDDVDRLNAALALRRLQGRRRPARPGVRPLLRDADRLLPRRLPHRAQPRRRPAARLPRLPDEVHRHRRRPTRSSATGASRCATTSTAPTSSTPSCSSTRAPRAGAVYNIGGGRESNCSMLEAIGLCERDRRTRARLDDERRGADRRPPLVDQRPRRVRLRLPGLAPAARPGDDPARDLRSRTPSAGPRQLHEALRRHPGPQRGGDRRRDPGRDRRHARARGRSTTR